MDQYNDRHRQQELWDRYMNYPYSDVSGKMKKLNVAMMQMRDAANAFGITAEQLRGALSDKELNPDEGESGGWTVAGSAEVE